MTTTTQFSDLEKLEKLQLLELAELCLFSIRNGDFDPCGYPTREEIPEAWLELIADADDSIRLILASQAISYAQQNLKSVLDEAKKQEYLFHNRVLVVSYFLNDSSGLIVNGTALLSSKLDLAKAREIAKEDAIKQLQFKLKIANSNLDNS